MRVDVDNCHAVAVARRSTVGSTLCVYDFQFCTHGMISRHQLADDVCHLAATQAMLGKGLPQVRYTPNVPVQNAVLN